MRRTRLASCIALFLTIAFLEGSAATTSATLRDRALPTCKVFDRPAALALDPSRTRPIAFARDLAIVAFPTYARRAVSCHVIRGVVSVASNADDSFWIAHANVVDRVMPLSDGGTWIPTTIQPCVPGDHVEAVAVNRGGQVEVAVSTHGAASAPELKLFDQLAHDVATPLRTFSSASLSSAVDDIAIDDHGTIYVYDDAGEILTFAANASGSDVRPLRTIAGPRTQLRPASPGASGTRHVGIDDAGDVAVTDASLVIAFPPNASGDVAPSDVFATEGPSYGIAVTRAGGVFVFSGFRRVDSFAPMAMRADKTRSGIPVQSMEVAP